MSTSRRKRLLSAGAAALAALTLITGCASSAPKPKESTEATPQSALTIDELRVGYVASGILGGAEGYAIAHGDFESDLAEAGIKAVTLTPFADGSKSVLQALVGGSIDIGFLGNSAFLTAKANGQDIVLLNETLVGLDLWVISRPGGPQTIEELNGAKIAVPFGDIQDRVGQEIAGREGIKDVEWVNVPPTAQAEALANGAVDAAVIIARGTWARLASEGYPVVTKVSENYPDLVGASVTVTTPQFLEAHPGFADAYEQARANAVALIQANVDDYNRFQADEFRNGSVTAEEESVYYPADRFQSEPFTEEGLELLRSELDWLVANGIAKQSFNLDDALASYK